MASPPGAFFFVASAEPCDSGVAEALLIHLSPMTIHSKFLGSVTVSGEDAKAFTRKLANGRGTKAAATSAANGRKLVATFAKKGAVTIKLKAVVAESTRGAPMKSLAKTVKR